MTKKSHHVCNAPDKYELLIKRWENDIKSYPDTEIGGYCRSVLRCCIRELNKVIVASKE